MEKLTTTQIGARLQCSERTVQRWIKSGKLPAELLPNGFYEVETADLERLQLPTVTTSASALTDILLRLETLEQQVTRLEAKIGTLSSQPHLSTITSKQPVSPSHSEQKEAAETVITLPDGLVGWRQFARLHKVSESTIHKAIKSGRLPVVQGPWRVGKVLYGEALNQDGRRRFHELYRLPLPCALCGMD